uniref:Uncharacterized protein n=1 Tax=Parascaris equorum TaxID=6256 RepID=A0A914S3V7_PAREQ
LHNNYAQRFQEIHDRLVEEREELKCILDSASFSGDLSDLIDDFKRLSMGYEDAIGRVEHFMSQIEKIQGRLRGILFGNWAVQALVVLTVMAVFTAWLVSTDNRIVSSWRGSIGPLDKAHPVTDTDNCATRAELTFDTYPGNAVS